jgi:hypothetical protein
MQLTDWLLVEVELLLIGLTHASFDKNSFDTLGRHYSKLNTFLTVRQLLENNFFLCYKAIGDIALRTGNLLTRTDNEI